MGKPWHTASPGALDLLLQEISADYSDLNGITRNGIFRLKGSYPVKSEGEVLDRFSVAIKLPHHFPSELPVVYEIGGRIPRTADAHINLDGSCCVFLPDERFRYWPHGAPFLQYLDGPVHTYFLGQLLREHGEPWASGERGHGTAGVREFYSELLGTADSRVIAAYLKTLSSGEVKGHWYCPCGGPKKLRNCHWNQVLDLRQKISAQHASTSLQSILMETVRKHS